MSRYIKTSQEEITEVLPQGSRPTLINNTQKRREVDIQGQTNQSLYEKAISIINSKCNIKKLWEDNQYLEELLRRSKDNKSAATGYIHALHKHLQKVERELTDMRQEKKETIEEMKRFEGAQVKPISKRVETMQKKAAAPNPLRKNLDYGGVAYQDTSPITPQQDNSKYEEAEYSWNEYEKASDTGDRQGAIQNLEDSLQKYEEAHNNGNPNASYALAEKFYSLREYDKAQEWINKTVEIQVKKEEEKQKETFTDILSSTTNKLIRLANILEDSDHDSEKIDKILETFITGSNVKKEKASEDKLEKIISNLEKRLAKHLKMPEKDKSFYINRLRDYKTKLINLRSN